MLVAMLSVALVNPPLCGHWLGEMRSFMAHEAVGACSEPAVAHLGFLQALSSEG